MKTYRLLVRSLFGGFAYYWLAVVLGFNFGQAILCTAVLGVVYITICHLVDSRA